MVDQSQGQTVFMRDIMFADKWREEAIAWLAAWLFLHSGGMEDNEPVHAVASVHAP